jgi:uncharacterized repeat protein (TIGR03803 family)
LGISQSQTKAAKAARREDNVIKLNSSIRACGIFLLWATAAIALPAQTTVAPTVSFTSLHSFDGTDGQFPSAALIQGTSGNLYGTTSNGGANNSGTVFKITANGALTTLYNFCSQSNCADGNTPEAGLIQATDGDFYGTTEGGGTNGSCIIVSIQGCGTVFKITPSGKLTTLYMFCSETNCMDGAYPAAGLVPGSDGAFYGTTQSGGANIYYGSVFRIIPSGKLTTLHSFNTADGAYPAAALVQGPNGNLYGTTINGGAGGECLDGCGTIFKIAPSGRFTTLHSFNYTNGYFVQAGMIKATDGDFYGTTSGGGASGNGTVFKITPNGMLTVLYNFDATDGAVPAAGLVQGTDGNFYGTTSYGGAYGDCNAGGCGTVFKITPSGALTTLYNFCSQGGSDCTDGAAPAAALIQATNGKFYGTTVAGGANDSCSPDVDGCGTVFSLSVGLK